MSKIFKSIRSERTLSVAGSAGYVALGIRGVADLPTNELGHRGVDLDAADAPAIALAILEAAGWPEDDLNSLTRPILNDLRSAVRINETMRARRKKEAKEAKEAADREVLEREARTLFDVGTDYLTEVATTARKPRRWDEVTENVRAAHIKVARAARELHGGTK